jgi:hypothetical protein
MEPQKLISHNNIPKFVSHLNPFHKLKTILLPSHLRCFID